MQVGPPCSDDHFGWDRVNRTFQVSLFPAVGYTVGLQGHKGIGASGTFPAATLSWISVLPCACQCVWALKSKASGVESCLVSTGTEEHLTQEIISSIPSLGRAAIIWGGGHWGCF